MLKEQQEEREVKARKALGGGLQERDQGRGVRGDQVFEEILLGLGRYRALGT